MDDLKKVLFLCTGNSCRSQMAEGWLRHLAGNRYEAFSAGTHPVGVNPRAHAVMAEVGVDLTSHSSDAVQDYLGRGIDLVVTVCGQAAESCPRWPEQTEVVHWPFDDPAGADGTEDAVLTEFRRVRDQIRARIEQWLEARATNS